MSSFSILINNLERFIRRFYFAHALKGLIYGFSAFLLAFVFFVVLEYFNYFSNDIKSIVLVSLVFLFLLFLGVSVIYPLFQAYNFGRILTTKDAARLIGRFFKGRIDDKLLNTLELKDLSEIGNTDIQLINESIEQKASQINVFPVVNAISYKDYLALWYIPVSVFSLLSLVYVFNFQMLREPIDRTINYSVSYTKPAPFEISFNHDFPLKIYEADDLNLVIQFTGEVLPTNVSLIIYETTIDINSTDNKGLFTHSFSRVKDSFEFFVNANGYKFGPYDIVTINRPQITSFTLDVTSPVYAQIEKKQLINPGEVSVLKGSSMEYHFFVEHVDKVIIRDSIADLNPTIDTLGIVEKNGSFSFSIEALASRFLIIKPISFIDDFWYEGEEMLLKVETVVDLYPQIEISDIQEAGDNSLYYQGLIMDDFGFSGLRINYMVINEGSGEFINHKLSIAIDEFRKSQIFHYRFFPDTFGLSEGDRIEYYFEVFDNDFVSGPKSTKSILYTYVKPTFKETIEENLAIADNISGGVQSTISEIDNIQDEIDELRRSMLDSENVTWEQQDQLKKLLEKQNEVEKRMNDINEIVNEFKNQEIDESAENKRLQDKREEVMKLFDELMNEELKDLYQKIQDELTKFNRQEMFEKLEDFSFEMEDLENRLDRALELFKRLQIESMLSQSNQLMDEIISKQDTINSTENLNEETVTEQEEVKENFDIVDDLLKKIDELNGSLKKKLELEDTDELQDEIAAKIDEILEKMKNESGNPGTAGEELQNDLKELKDAISQNLSTMQQGSLAEDAATLREILDNLIKSSFAQEKLIEESKTISIRDPLYVSLIQNQRKISEDISVIKDSLIALSRRQVEIQSIVNREISQIDFNIEEAVDHLVNRRKANASSRQQFAMTHLNNLALLLNESLQNMQNQMQSQSGQGTPQQSGQGAEGMQNLQQMQEQMNKMLEELQKGNIPQSGSPGDGNMGLSERLARMAAEQEAIRRKMSEILEEAGLDGNKNGLDSERLLQDMERTELDIIQNRVNRQTLLRQQNILTRMLEHERALLEREMDNKRVGETANFYELSNPNFDFEYNYESIERLENLRYRLPVLRPHYKSLLDKYLINVQE